MSLEITSPQAVSSSFNPPVDIVFAQTSTIPEIFEWCEDHNPQHPLFRYWNGTSNEHLLYSDVVPAIRRAAHRVIDDVQEPLGPGRPPVIAVLAIADTISYITFFIGMMRAGYTIFPISIRNNAAAVAHLLARTEARHLYVSADPGMQGLAREAVKLLESDNGQDVKFHAMPFFEELYTPGKGNDSKEGLPTQYNREEGAFILHSSGSTSMPKPITWSHAAVFTWTVSAYVGTTDLADMIVGAHALPMFHMMGIVPVFVAPSCGWVMAVFKPSFPPTVPTDSVFFEAILQTETQLPICVPAFAEIWSRDPTKVAHLKRIGQMMYGGGPIAKEVGDYLVSQGIKVFMTWGSTELGVVNVMLPKDVGPDWNYTSFCKQYLVHWIPRGEDTYELAMKRGPYSQPRVVNTQIDGVDAYATNDVFVEHPTKKGWWRTIGRADDQIVLSNGEKVNPGPLEAILALDPRVQSAIVFGRGKFQVGALLDVKKDFAFDPADTAKLEEFRNAIWPTVERMNAIAPQHGRLFKEMITVASPSKPFAYTAKATPRRQVVTKMYDDEIEALYDAVDQSSQINVPPPATWSPEETLQFIRTGVTNVLEKPISDEDDIFQRGGDSLQATWIRNTITRALRAAHPAAARSLPPNLVYETPTIESLTRRVLAAISGGTDSGAVNKVDEMRRLVEKYTSDFPSRPQSLRSDKPAKDIVLLSGTTGGLGSDILSHLIHDDSVALVYAYNRKSADVAERQKKAFRERGLDEADLLSEKFKPIEGDMTKPYLGLEQALYEEVRDSVTHIIHNAWRVDFNLSLASFEPNIKSARKLVDLALTSSNPDPARLLFVGSVSVLHSRPPSKEPVPEEHIDDPAIAVGSGYGESKWVTETILRLASEKTALRPVSVRLGQVCGNRTGYWNEREWVPAIVKTALYQKCLPDAEGAVSWIPSYDATAAIAQMRNSPYPTLHIAHPHPVPWTDLFRPLAEQLGVPLVPYAQWLEALQSSLQSGEDEVELQRKNPALRLLGFFSYARLSDEYEPIGLAKLSIAKALEVAPALNIRPLNGEDAKTWVDAWARAGFLPDTSKQ